jgi:hypothetical protein
MRTGPGDTDAETEAAHLKLLRAATPDRRLALALSLSRSVMALARDAFARQSPAASQTEIGLQFVARCYGADLAEEVRMALAERRS